MTQNTPEQQSDDSGASGTNQVSHAPNDHATDPAGAEKLVDGKLSPELLEWARQQFTEEEIVVGLRELRAKGGLELEDFLAELEQVVHARERSDR